MGLFKKKKRDNDLRYVGTLQDAYRDVSSINESPTYYSWGQKNSDRIYASHVPHYGIWCLRTEMCDGLRVTKTVTMLTHKLEEMSYKYKIKSIEGLNRDNNIVLYWYITDKTDISCVDIAIEVIEQCGCWYVRVNTADGRSLMIFVEDMYWDKRREDGTIQESANGNRRRIPNY